MLVPNEVAVLPVVVEEGLEPPKFQTAGAAGLDLCAAEDVKLSPGETARIRTGVKVAIPKGYVGLLFLRSGTAWKKHLRLVNGVGVIDSDYRGEILVAVQYLPPYNEDDSVACFIGRGERIAQLVIVPYLAVPVLVVNQLDDTERGEGGFGSTGQ